MNMISGAQKCKPFWIRGCNALDRKNPPFAQALGDFFMVYSTLVKINEGVL